MFNKDKEKLKEAPFVLVGGQTKERILRIQALIKENQKQNKKVGVLSSIETKEFYQEADIVLAIACKRDLKAVTRNLFENIQELNKNNVDIILSETFPAKEIDDHLQCL